MPRNVAIIGAGVSGLTGGVLFAEQGYRVSILAEETGQQTTSGAAAAIWYPYDAEPAGKVIPWALTTYQTLVDLARDPPTGVSMIELRTFSLTDDIQIPGWAHSLGARRLGSENVLPAFTSGFTLKVPLLDTTIYLDYLANRFRAADGEIKGAVRLGKLDDVDPVFDLIVNCAGIGAKTLVDDADLEPHRGQVAVVPRIDNLPCAIVSDDPPLMYAIPRANDCVFGGTNELSENRNVDSAVTTRIVAECSRVLDIDAPKVLAERVGLRPFRKSGVRLDRDKLRDGRSVIHNYGHGGSGFTLSWGCAGNVVALAGI